MENNNKWDKVEVVLTRVHDFLGRLVRDGRCDDHCSECFGASGLALDVWDVLHGLKHPPRNCDVGTAEEQAERFFAFCNSNKCPSCPCRFTKKTDCALIWAQMPYEKGDNDGSK